MFENETSNDLLLMARNIVQEFEVHSGFKANVLHALSDVSFDIKKGETLGLVGESGSGKTTLARALAQTPRPKSGSVHFRGHDLTRLRGRSLREHRRQMQLVFQDPFGSLDPLWRVCDLVEEPLIGYRVGDRAQRQRKVAEVLARVGLPHSSYGQRRPRELSGGECQRVAIARALTLDPALIICDEAVSALDVLIQSQLLDLFQQLGTELGLSYLFISHDLAVVKQISDRIAVLHFGEICEIGPVEAIYREPRHPYTEMLLACASIADFAAQPYEQWSKRLSCELPSPLSPARGCRFRSRCPKAQERCGIESPRLRCVGGEHFVACHFAKVPPHTIETG